MNEFKVGLLALATMAAVVYMSLKVTTNQSGFGDYIQYKTIITDASGIFPKTPIKIAGINAGRLTKIELLGNQALITFEVLKSVKVTPGTVLRVKTVGFLGDKFLELYIEKSDDRLEKDAFILSEDAGGMDKIVKDVSSVMKDVKVIVSSMKDSIAPKGKEPPITAILQNTKDLTVTMKETMEKLRKIVSDNEGKMGRIATNFEKMSKNLSAEFDRENSDSSINALREVLDNAKKMTADMQQLVADVKSGKGTIGKLLVEEQIADQVSETLAGVQKIIGKVDAIRTELEVYSGVNSDNGSTTSADLKIFPSPERFYLLGISTSTFGLESEKHTTTEVNGISTTEIRKEKKKNELRFNVQLGRRIHQWSFRGGLIESTGGFGVDYDHLAWNTRYIFEMFDYQEDLGLQLRTGLEVQLWNVFYGKGTAEIRVFGDEYHPTATLSGGLRFDDEDLKGIIGFFL